MIQRVQLLQIIVLPASQGKAGQGPLGSILRAGLRIAVVIPKRYN